MEPERRGGLVLASALKENVLYCALCAMAAMAAGLALLSLWG